LGAGPNAGRITADGSRVGARVIFGIESISPDVEFLDPGTRTLTLSGSNRGDNEFNLVLGDGAEDANGLHETSLTKTGNGTWLLTRNNTYSGETLVLAGILAATVDGAFGEAGGAGIVIGGGTNGSQVLGGLNATVDLRNVDYSSIDQMYLSGGTLATTVGDSSWAGSVFVTANSLINVSTGSTLELRGDLLGVLGGSGALTKTGDGTLVISSVTEAGTRDSAGITTASVTVQAGTLKLDYTTNNGTYRSKLSDTSALVLGGSRLGGTLELAGAATAYAEIVSGVTLATGDNQIVRTSGLAILRMNGVGRQSGATVNFSHEGIASIDTGNVTGILGAWATIGGTDWATKSNLSEAGAPGSATAGDRLVMRYTGYNTGNWVLNDTTGSSSGNMDVIVDNTQNNAMANTLRFNLDDSGGNNERRLTLTGNNFLQTGGILITPNMGSSTVIIDGDGTLTVGRQGSTSTTSVLPYDLMVIQNNPGAAVEISAVIADNDAGRQSRLGVATSSTITFTGSGSSIATDLAVGMRVYGPGIAAGTIITALGTNTVTLSKTVGAGAGSSLEYYFDQNKLDVNTDRTGTTTTGTTTVSGITDTSGLYIGMGVAGAGIPEGTVITAIGTNSNITLSAPAVTTASNVPLSFYQVTGLDKLGIGKLVLTGANTYTGTNLLNNGSLLVKDAKIVGMAPSTSLTTSRVNLGRSFTVADTAGLTYGQAVSGPGIVAGTTIAAINNGTTFTTNQGAIISSTEDLTFGVVAPKNGAISSTTATNSTTVTVPGGTAGLTRGQTVTGTGIVSGTTIATIVDGTRITLSLPATTSGTRNLTYGTVSGTIFVGQKSTVLTSGARLVVANTLGLTIGQTVSGSGIPTGAVVTRIFDDNTFEISAPVTATGTVNLTYGVSGDVGHLGQEDLLTTTTSGSTVVTVGSTAGLSLGQEVTGLGIAAGTTVVAILSDTQVVLSNAALFSGTTEVTFAGSAGGLGMSRSAATNLVFNGGIFRYNGTSGITDRGFSVNTDAFIDVGGAYATLEIGGNITTPTAEDSYSIVKSGAGTLELKGTLTPGSGSYGLENLTVLDGVLRLKPAFFDQFVRNDVGGLTLGGGTLEIAGGYSGSSLNQTMPGDLVLLEGASTIIVSTGPTVNTTLILQDPNAPNAVRFDKGSTLLFVENHGALTGDANIQLAGLFGIDVQVIIPRTVFTTNTDIQTPGVNYFGFVDFNGISYNVIPSDNISLGGTAAHTIQPDPFEWTLSMNVMDGALSLDAFAGTTDTNAHVSTIRFFNSSYVGTSPGASTVTILDLLTLEDGAILQTTHAGNHVNSITGGAITSNLINTDGTSVDFILHNWNPLLALAIESQIVDNAASGRVLNLVQAGDGTTAVSGYNTYTGTTYLHRGVLRVDSSTALPGNSHLRIDGGVLGLNSDDFYRSVGTGDTEVDWTGSGGFAAYGSTRIVNLGAAGASLAWGLNGFVPNNDSLVFGAQDADALLVFQNGIELGREDHLIEVISGKGAWAAYNIQDELVYSVDAEISGAITGFSGKLVKGGLGVLELSGDNSFEGGISVAEGKLIGSSSTAFGTGQITVGATTDTRAQHAALELEYRGNALGSDIFFGSSNLEGYSMLRSTSANAVFSGRITLSRTPARNVLFNLEGGATATFQDLTNPDGANTGGFTLMGGGTMQLTGANDYGTQTGGSGAGLDGGTVVRAGTLLVGHSNGLGSTTVELGDATFVKAAVAFSTNGASVLGVERDTPYTANNRASLGGVFLSDGDGTTDIVGNANTGPGAFYEVNPTIDGHTFTVLDIGARILVKDEVAYPERNGIYEVVSINADGTMNLVRAADFDTAAEMRYGSQVTVTGGSLSGTTFFMASPDISVVNGAINGAAVVVGSTTVQVGSTAGLIVGQSLSGTGIADGSYIAGILDGTHIVLSQAAVRTAIGVSLLLDNTDPSQWVTDVVNPDARLLASASSLNIANDVDVNSNGSTGLVVLGARSTVLSGTVEFSGTITLQDILTGTAENRLLTLQSYTGAAGNGDGVTFSGVISSANAEDVLSIEKIGSGRVTLDAANSYTGVTTISSGVLRISNSLALGGTANGTTVASGATLELYGGITVSGEALTLNGSGVYDIGFTETHGALLNAGGTNYFYGPITLATSSRIQSDAGLLVVGDLTGTGFFTDLTLAGTSNLTVEGVIALGSGRLYKEGPGTALLEGLSTYTGETTIKGGTLSVVHLGDGGSPSGIGQSSNDSSKLIINGGALQYSGAGDSTDRGFKIGNTATLDASGVVSVVDTGVVNFTNTAAIGFVDNVYGPITLTLAGTNDDANTLAALITDRPVSGQTDVFATAANGTNVLSLYYTYGLQAGQSVVGTGIPDGTVIDHITGTDVYLTQNVTVDNPQVSFIDRTSIVKEGFGTWVLSNANTFGGSVTVNGGRLQVTNASGLQNSSGLTVNYGGAFHFTPGTGVQLTLPALTLADGSRIGVELGSAAFSGGGALVVQGVAAATAGTVTLDLYALASTAGGTYRLISAPTGGLAGASNYVLGTIFNNPNVVVTNIITDDQYVDVAIKVTPEQTALYWLGGVSNVWSASDGETMSNWTLDAAGLQTQPSVPTGVTAVTLSSSNLGVGNQSNMTLGVDMTVKTLTINDPAGITLDGPNKLSVVQAAGAGVAINVTNTAGLVTLNAPIKFLATSASISVSNALGLVINGSISGANTSLTKLGSGVLTLAGANTFIGTANVSAGILRVAHGSALGSTGAGTSVADGASLELDGNVVVGNEDLTLNGDGVGAVGSATYGSLRNYSGNNTWGGTVTLGTTAPVGIQSAAGLLTFSNAQSITGSGKSLVVDGAGNTTVVGAITTGSGTITKWGTGTLTLEGANTFTGQVTINDGVLAISNSSALGTTSATGVAVTTGATSGTLALQNSITVGAEGINIKGAGFGGGGALRNLSGNNTWGGLVTLGANATISSDAGVLTLDVASGNAVSGNFILTVDGAGTTVIADNIGTAQVLKKGTGTLIFGTGNTYTGLTTIENGNLLISTIGALGGTGVGTLVKDGGTLEVQTVTTLALANELLTINGAGFGGAGALRSLSGNVSYAATVTLGSNARIQADAGQLTLNATTAVAGAGFTLNVGGVGTTVISGIIATDTGGVTKDGSGLLVLSGANTYTGATSVNEGTLAVTTMTGGGVASSLGKGTGAASVVINGGTLSYIGAAGTSDRLFSVGANGGTFQSAGTGAINLNSSGAMGFNGQTGDRTLTLDASVGSGLNILNMTIGDHPTSGVTSLTKTGGGVWSLSGVHTFTGVTTVTQGTLRVTNAGGLQNTLSLVVDDGATFEFLPGTGDQLKLTNNLNGGVAAQFGSVSTGTIVLGLELGHGAFGTTSTSGAIITDPTSGLGNAQILTSGNIVFRLTGLTGETVPGDYTLLRSNFQGLEFGAYTIDTNNLINLDQFTITLLAPTSQAVTVNVALTPLYTGYWVGGQDNAWLTPSNWAANSDGSSIRTVLPSAVSDIFIASSIGQGLSNMNLGGSVSIHSLTFVSPGTAQINSGGSLTIAQVTADGSAITVASNAGAATINANVTLGSDATISVNNTAGLTLGGVVSGLTGKLTKDGIGKLSLTAANTFTGAIVISGGVLSTNNLQNGGIASGIGTSSNAAESILLNGGTLQYTGVVRQTDRLFSLGALGGGIDNSGSGPLEFTNSGSMGLVDSGDRTLTLGGTNSDVNIMRVTINNGANGVTTVAKAGSGTWRLAANNGYSGATVVNAGVLVINSIANGGAISVIGASSNEAQNLVLNGGTLRYTGVEVTTDRRFSVGTNGGTIEASGSGALYMVSPGSMGFNGQLGARTLTLAGSNQDNNQLSLIIGDQGGSTSLVKNGAGKWILTAANTFGGSVTVVSGILDISNSTALGTTAAGTSVADGATLEVQASVTVGAEALSVTGSGVAGAGVVHSINGFNQWGGTVTLTGAALIKTDMDRLTFTAPTSFTGINRNLTIDGAGDTTISGAITTGSGSLTKNGSGTLLISGSNTYTGATNVNEGILSIGSVTALGTAVGQTFVADGATLGIQGSISVGPEPISVAGSGVGGAGALRNFSGTNNLGGLVSLGTDATLGSDAGLLTLTASNSISGADHTITFTGAGNFTVNGTITTGSGGIIKNGAGTARLNGVNSFTGDVTINGGILTIGNSASLGSTTLANLITVNTGGSLELGGGITLSAFKTLYINGPGSGGTGALRALTGNNTVSGLVTLQSASSVQVDAGTLTLAKSDIAITGTNTNLSVGGNGTLNVNGQIIIGTGDLTKTGAGTTTLNKTNTYGNTTVNGGTLRAGIAGAFNNAGTVTVNSLIAGTATYDLNSKSGEFVSLAFGGAGGTSGSVNNVNIGSAGIANLLGSVTLDATGDPLGASILGTSAARLQLGLASTIFDIADSANPSTTAELTISASIIELNAGSEIVKNGAGVLRLSGANSFKGAVTVNAGTVSVGSATGLGTVDNGVVVMDGASLEYVGTFTAANEAISIEGAGAGGSGALRLLSGSVTYGGTVMITDVSLNHLGRIQVDAGNLTLSNAGTAITGTNVNLTLGGNGNLTVNGAVIIGNGGITKTGAGIVLLNKINTYLGNTVVNGGTLRAGILGAFNAASDVTVNSLVVSGTATYDFNSKGGQIAALTFGGVDGGSGSTNNVNLGSAGTVTLAGPVTYINNTTEDLLGANILGTSSARLQFGTTSTVFDIADSTNPLTTAELTISASITELSASSGIVKNGLGVLRLTGANSFSGPVTVNAGTVSVGSASGLGTAGGDVTVMDGASLEYSGSFTALAEHIFIEGTGVAGAGALRMVSGSVTYGGLVTLNNAASIQVDAGTFTMSNAATAMAGTDFDVTLGGAGTLTINGEISLGAGGITKTGSGLVLLNKANTYNGATVVAGGTLRAGTAGVFGNTSSIKVDSLNNSLALLDFNSKGGTLPGGLVLGGTGGASAMNNVSLGTAGTVTLGGNVKYDATNAPLGSTISGSGSARFDLNGSTRTFDVGFSANAPIDLTVSATIMGTGVGIVKAGAGILQLSAANLYTGTTTVNAGTLSYGVANAINSASVVTVDSTENGSALLDLNGKGGTLSALVLGGTGGVSAENNVTLGSSGTLTLSGNIFYLATGNPLGSSITGTGTARISLTGTSTINVANSTSSDHDLTIGVIMMGSGGFTKAGVGNLLLSAASAITGTTTVRGGTLTFGVQNAVSTTSAVVVNASNGGTALIDLNGLGGTFASLTFGGTGGTSTAHNSVTIGSGNPLVLNGNVTYDATGNPTGAVIFGDGGIVSLAATRTFAVNDSSNAATDLTVDALLTGAGGITKTGAGKLLLTQSNSNIGVVTVNAGILAYGAPNAINASSSLTINATTPGVDAIVDVNSQGAVFPSLTFGGTGAAANGVNQLTLGGGSTLLVLNGNVTYLSTNNPGAALISSTGAQIELNQVTRTFNVNDSTNVGPTNAELTINAEIVNVAGTAGITKTGTGRLLLAHSNSYNGTTTISQGTLVVGDSAALGTGAVTVANGAALELNGDGLGINNTISVTGTGVGGTGALRNVGGSNSLNASIALGGATTIQSDSGALAIYGILSRPATPLTFAGDGNITVVNGVSISTGSLTKYNDGTTTIGALGVGATYTGATVVYGGTLAINSSHNFAAVTISASTTSTAGTATLAMNGASNEVTSLTFGASGAKTGGQNVLSLAASSVLKIKGNVTVVTTSSQSGASITAGSGAQIDLNDTSATVNRTFTVGDSAGLAATDAELTVAAQIINSAGIASLTKTGLGRLLLTNANNSYNGTTTVSQGVLSISDDGAIGVGAVTVASGASLELNGNGIDLVNSITVSGTGVGGAGALRSLGGNNSFIGAITLGGATTFQSDNGTMTIGDPLSRPATALTFGGNGNIVLTQGVNLTSGSLTKYNDGTTTIGTNADYTGATTVYGGTLAINPSHSFGAVTISASTTSNAGTATLAINGTLTPNSVTSLTFGVAGAKIGGLNKLDLGAGSTLVLKGNVSVVTTSSQTGAIISDGGGALLDLNDTATVVTRTFTVGDSAGVAATAPELTIDAKITNTAGTANLIKTGLGRLLLTNGANDYNGTTTVSQGILSIGDAGALDGGTVTVANGASLELNGNNINFANNITVTGTGAGGSGALRNMGGMNFFQGTITLGGATTFQSDSGTMVISGLLNRAATALTFAGDGDIYLTAGVSLTTGALTKYNDGVTTLPSTGQATYTGSTTVYGGTLAIGPSHSFAAVTISASTTSTAGIATLDMGGLNNEVTALTFGATGAKAGGQNVLLLRDSSVLKLKGNVTVVTTSSQTGASISNSLAQIDLSDAAAVVTRTFTVGDSAGVAPTGAELTIDAKLTNSAGTANLTKSGLGRLLLTNAGNDYNGTTTVSQGILAISDAGALGTGLVTVISGASLELNGNTIDYGDALTVTGTGFGGTGALRNVGGDNTFSGLITLGGATTIQSDSGKLTISQLLNRAATALTFGGNGDIDLVAGVNNTTGSITKYNDGITTILGGATVNYSGATNVYGGTLAVQEAHGFGAVTISASTTSVLGKATLLLDGAGATSYGVSALTFGAAGAKVGGENRLELGDDDKLILNGNVTVVTTSSQTGASITGGLGATMELNSASAARTFTVNNSTDPLVDVELSIDVQINNAAGTGGITKTGLGTLLLTRSGGFTGATTVSQGILSLAWNTALGSGAVTVANGASLELRKLSSNVVIANNITVTGTGFGGTGALRSMGGDNQIHGTVTLGGATTIQADDGSLTIFTQLSRAATALTFGGNGDINVNAGVNLTTGSLTKYGDGTATISTAAAYSGATTVNGGTLAIEVNHDFAAVTISASTTSTAGSATLEMNGAANTVTALTFGATGAKTGGYNELALAAGSSLDLNGNVTVVTTSSQTGAVISGGAGAQINLSTTRTFTVNNSTATEAELTINPVITGAGGITKSGVGTLVLAAANTYAGTTLVSQGNLQVGVDGTGTTGGAAVTVNSGATLSGYGEIAGVANVTAHAVKGILSPGTTGGLGNGVLTVDGNLTINTAGSQIVFGITNRTGIATAAPGVTLADLDISETPPAEYEAALNSIAATFATSAPGAVTDHDLLVVNGTLLLSSSTRITVNDLGASLDLGNVYNLIDATLINGTTFNVGGAQRNGGLIGNLSLPTLVAGLKWDTTKFLSDGLLVIVDPPIIWKGGEAADPTSWTNGGNWLYEDGTVAGSPTAYSEVVLSGAGASGQGAMTLNEDVSVKKITVSDSADTTLSGNGTVTIVPLVADGSEHEAITVHEGAGTATFNTGFNFAEGARITVDNATAPGAAGGLVLQGRISANKTLIKAGSGNLALNNAILAVGARHGTSAETLNVVLEGTGGFSMNDSLVEMDIFSGGSSDRLVFTGTLGGNDVSLVDTHFAITAAAGTEINGGDTWDLVDWSNLNFEMNFNGDIASFFDLPTLGEGMYWNLDDFIAHGQISAVPEPGRAMLLLFGLMALFMRRRRRHGATACDS